MNKLVRKIKIEVCCYNVESALSAKNAGVERIELCDNFQEGGTTPSIGTIQYIKNQIEIDVFVIIRPRGGDFLYTSAEFEVIKNDVKAAISAGCDGIVSGFLMANGRIDIFRTKEILNLCGEIPFTFHRAFDLTPDPFEALEELTEIGVRRVLTSGQRSNVSEGKELLKKLNKQADGRIIILPGGGINSENVMDLVNHTGVSEIHLSGKRFFNSQMSFIRKDVPMNTNAIIREDQILKSDQKIIEEIKCLLNKG